METKTKLTAEEFFKLYPEESRVELIDGEVYEIPAPEFIHQEIIARIFIPLRLYTEEKGMGKVVLSPVDVVLDEETMVQPDLVYLSDRSKIKKKIYGTPDIVVEVVSASSLKRDVQDKKKLYEAFGVKEYWLIFPLERNIMVYELTQKGYELFSYATEKGRMRSKVLEGFELDAEEIFGGL